MGHPILGRFKEDVDGAIIGGDITAVENGVIGRALYNRLT
jgi:hypothetical protein